VIPSIYALCFFHLRIVSVVLGAAIVLASIRQRSKSHWPVLGAAALSVLAGTVSINVMAGSQLGVSSSLLPFLLPFSRLLGDTDAGALGEGLARAAIMLIVALAPACVHGTSSPARQHRQ
jgi:hypothetical protein